MGFETDIFEINDLDGFDFLVEVFVEPWSKEIEIINLFDLDMEDLDNDFYEFFIAEYYDEILEEIHNQSQAKGDY